MSIKRFFVDLHGCVKNQVDAELMIGIMEKNGWQNSPSAETADLIIVNSCGFIEPAKEESVNAVINARAAYPHAKILLAGCLAERYAEVLSKDMPEADAVFGNGDLFKLPEIVEKMFFKAAGKKAESWRVLTPPQEGVCSGFRPKVLNFPRSVYIKITEGCENFCSFCAIPIIRGKLRSRPIEDIVSEIRDFAAKGFYEFNLIGQDLAAFQIGRVNGGKGQSGLAALLEAISSVKGDFKIRLLYIHPDHFSSDILPVMCADPRFLPYFDIPFQSGSEKIIRAMNRTGSAETYLQLAETIRAAFKKAASPYGEPAIRTTFLIGFPGETDGDFAETAAFLQRLEPLWSGGFVYSREEDTAAYSFKNRVPKKIAQKRLSEIQKIQTEITAKRLDGFCGKESDILVEEIIPAETTEDSGSEGIGLALGRAWFQAPEVDGSVVLHFSEDKRDINGGPIRAGSIVRAKILSRNGFDLNAAAR